MKGIKYTAHEKEKAIKLWIADGVDVFANRRGFAIMRRNKLRRGFGRHAGKIRVFPNVRRHVPFYHETQTPPRTGK